ncbi:MULTISPECIES: DUF4294 domain-containing protein [Pedobacter]|uniref:DUF4294 domain-containing protein n=1 Tax=Pedobacter heparinus (strain ATCC 13125 / DSM 2366 / CIP 104194 / JCM 7457 / NBRC 12017 / NCIMB 9290 / NRRL B-14731 / HIM 762-3) TaxID=485917 RepID=C6XS79_PEDHD|nr:MULTISPECIES: DUF4294 domain-containing protein [Pedobacter]ACU03424.1 hypothetical protein Phep_1206 [Pedobacter heparinus DSM 2366]MBB5439098.1 hypothetical protein [Pedobacter sp. AK017]
MNFYRLFILSIVIISGASAKAQVSTVPVKMPVLGKNDTIRVASTNDNGEMIPWIPLNEVEIFAMRLFKSPADRAAFNRLRYNVMKVMPYALFAKRRYEQLERDLALTTEKKEQKKLVKQCDKEIKEMFNREIKELTITQGQILTKLIDRELGRTTYDIIKETKGGVTAFLYQSVARVVGHNLKSTYSPQEDRDIESIIVSSGFYQ